MQTEIKFRLLAIVVMGILALISCGVGGTIPELGVYAALTASTLALACIFVAFIE